MNRFLALLAATLLLGACQAPREEEAVLRLLELSVAAESRWPRQRPRMLPREIEGLRTYRQLRTRKVGRVSMFPEDGGDSRLALVSPTGTRHRFKLQLPSDAIMRLGLGYLPPAEGEGTGVRFVVRIGAPGEQEKEKLVNQAITTSPDGGWQDFELDLSRWSGQEVELSLVTLGVGGGGEDESQVWAAWSAPEILSRRVSQNGPDVILISLDTLRADRLGCYGYPRKTSPNLDRLASRGIRFETAVSQAPWTLPSHEALFTGLFPTASAMGDAPRLAEVLRGAGYRTDALTGGGQMDFRMGFSPGFETYRLFDWIRNMEELEGWLERSSGRRRFLFLHTYEIHDPYIQHRACEE